jgi:hypothetical protein
MSGDLTALVAAFPGLAALRDAATAYVADYRTAMTALAQSQPTALVGPEAIAQARAYMDTNDAEHVRDNVAGIVWNTLQATVPGPATEGTRSVGKIDLMNAHPEILGVVAQWRAATATNPMLAEGMRLWDAQANINAFDPLSAALLDALVTAGICSTDLRAVVEGECRYSIPGAFTTALAVAGVTGATLADVRAAVVAAGV